MESNQTTIKNIYKKIPYLRCKKKCHAACGIIHVSQIEKDIIRSEVGYEVWDDTYYASLLNGTTQNYSCPLLKNNECSIYEKRPLICRIFGVVKKMKCPYGCKPIKWLSDIKARLMLRKLDYDGENK